MNFIRQIGREEPAPPWGLISALLYMVAAFAAVLIGTTVGSILTNNAPLGFVVGYAIGAIIMAMLVTFTRNRTLEDREALKLGDAPLPLIIMFLLGLGMGIFFDILGLIFTGNALPTPELFGFFDFSGTMEVIDPGIFGWGIAVLLMVVFQPVGEELIFRGVLYPSLRSALGPWMGYLMNAVFYGIFHLLAYAPAGGGFTPTLTWYTLILPVLSGMFLAWTRAYTRSTRAAIAAHAGLGLFLVLRAMLLAG